MASRRDRKKKPPQEKPAGSTSPEPSGPNEDDKPETVAGAVDRAGGENAPQAAAPERGEADQAELVPSEDSEDEGKKPTRGLKHSLVELVIIILIAALLAVAIQSFFVRPFVIPSSSMTPTLEIGDRIMAEKVTYYFRKPRRGDIIVFRYPPTDASSLNTANPFYWPFEQVAETLHLAHRGVTPFVKRVVATGGETVELKKGKLYIDGKEIKEDYANLDNSDYGPTTVPAGELFCLGDNRANSRDSRYWGTVPIRSVIGRVFLIWWPPSRFQKP